MMIALVLGIVLTIATLLLTILTISRGYGFVHTVDPLNEGDEVREFTGSGERV